jgi:hypothetical protein
MSLRTLTLATLALSVAPAVVAVPAPAEDAAPAIAVAADGPTGERHDCLAAALCALKARVGGHTHPWTDATCQTVADAVIDSAARHDLSPALLLAVMMNESDLDETAARSSRSGTHVAKDSGLMGNRCVLDRRGRCTNSLVRGLAWRDVMDPATNVELGARYLAHYRSGRHLRCRHRDHAWWAHYNHGTRYIAHGPASEYPHHVAILYDALARTFAYDDAELRAKPAALRGDASARHEALAARIRATSVSCELPPAYAEAASSSRPTRL